MNAKKRLILVTLVMIVALMSIFLIDNIYRARQAGIANPASVYCQEQGGKLEIRTGADGGQVGVCVFANGSECEEWAYYYKECAPAP
jgi:putative hemolysin